jgi:ribosome-associated protein
LIVNAARDKKAWKPVKLNVKKVTALADYFVVCEGDTDRQVRAIADHMIHTAREAGHRALSVEGYEEASWVVIDFDAVIAHVMLPGEREYYDLEALWQAPQMAELEARRAGA